METLCRLFGHRGVCRVAGKYDDETFDGNLFRIYTKSHFLDHLGRDTGGHTEAIRHYKLRQIGPVSSAPTQIQ